MAEALERGLLKQVDLLALNRDEAASLTGLPSPQDNASLEPLVESLQARLRQENPTLRFILTAGAEGSWSWDGKTLTHLKAFPTRVVGTAGAGDAFLAGVLAGWAANLSLAQSQELGGLTAAQAITSPHTIAPDLDALSLSHFAHAEHLELSEALWKLLPQD
jgi:sugar/nucleoside kinase (ribokinase family)